MSPRSVLGAVTALFLVVLGAAVFTAHGGPGSTSRAPRQSVGGELQQGTTSTAIASSSSAAKGYAMSDVAEHNSASSCWTAINGAVYDVTQWINRHPGGAAAILSLCGTDGSAAFNAQHGGERRPASELASFKIGTLAN